MAKTIISTAKTAQGKGAPVSQVVGATEEQKIYANILNISMRIGLAAIIASFAVYVGGVTKSYVPRGEISQLWAMRSHDYLEATNIQSGWSWVNMYSYGDFLNFFPIAFLAGITIICYAAIIPTLLRKKDTVYAALAALEVLVLLAAASGLIAGGGH